MRHSIILFVLILFSTGASGQPKITLHLGTGYYEPNLTGFDTNNLLPATNFISGKTLLGQGMSIQFFPNARFTFLSLSSYHNDQTTTGVSFNRRLTYRFLSIETFMIYRRRLEFNFSLSGIMSAGRIGLETSNVFTDWDDLLASFGNGSISVSSSDRMTANWYGFASFIGLRFYILSWLSLDLKTGFMKNFYKENNWRFQGQKVVGPALEMKDLPVFTGQLVIGW